jgi:hypothetical protein
METYGDGLSRSRRSGRAPASLILVVLAPDPLLSRRAHETTEDEVGPAVGQLPVGSVERLGILVTNEASAVSREPRRAGVSLAF